MTLAHLLGLLAASAVATASPRVDLVYEHHNGKPELLRPYAGYPMWQLQARCAGVMDGIAAYYTGRSRRAERAVGATQASAFFADEARARLMIDRRIDRTLADRTMAESIAAGRRQFDRAIADRASTFGVTPANVRRSECVELYRDYVDRQTADEAPEFLRTDRNRIVCLVKPQAGSRKPKRVCRMRAQIEEIQADSQEMYRKMTAGGAGGSPDQ